MKEDNKINQIEDQVEKFLQFQTVINVHYISLEFTEHQAFQNKKNNEVTSKAIDHLENSDPIRKVLKMMDDVDQNTEDFQGSSDLKSKYMVIKSDLENFVIGI